MPAVSRGQRAARTEMLVALAAGSGRAAGGDLYQSVETSKKIRAFTRSFSFTRQPPHILKMPRPAQGTAHSHTFSRTRLTMANVKLREKATLEFSTFEPHLRLLQPVAAMQQCSNIRASCQLDDSAGACAAQVCWAVWQQRSARAAAVKARGRAPVSVAGEAPAPCVATCGGSKPRPRPRPRRALHDHLAHPARYRQVRLRRSA